MINMILILLFMSDSLEKELNEELIRIASHPNRWWSFCVSEDEKKEINPIFIE